MADSTVQAERAQQTTNMVGLRLGGALWVMAGVSCAGLLLFVFVGENLLVESLGLSVLFLGGAVGALVTGGLLLARPAPRVVRWSRVAGVAWLLAFGSLALPGLADPNPDRDPLMSLAIVIGFGVAGSLVTYWSAGRSAASGEMGG